MPIGRLPVEKKLLVGPVPATRTASLTSAAGGVTVGASDIVLIDMLGPRSRSGFHVMFADVAESKFVDRQTPPLTVPIQTMLMSLGCATTASMAPETGFESSRFAVWPLWMWSPCGVKLIAPNGRPIVAVKPLPPALTRATRNPGVSPAAM